MSYLPNLLYLLSLFSSSFRGKRFGALSFASGTTLSRYVWQFAASPAGFFYSTANVLFPFFPFLHFFYCLNPIHLRYRAKCYRAFAY